MGKKFVLQSKYFPRRHTQKDIEGIAGGPKTFTPAFSKLPLVHYIRGKKFTDENFFAD